MITVPQLVLIGGADQAQRTTYASRLVQRLAALGPVGAAMITVLDAGGVSVDGEALDRDALAALADKPYVLRGADGSNEHPDDRRLRSAGAGLVWRLLVRAEHLDAGLAAWAAQLDQAVPVVAMSAAARLGLEPGLFLLLQKMRDMSPELPLLADALIEAVEETWNVPPESLRFSGGRWRLGQDVGAVVLAGGRSRRMGRDKALLPWAGRPLIAHIVAQVQALCDDLLIGANDPERFAFLRCPVVPDLRPGEGPLMGLASCLAASTHECNVVVSCDVPTIDVHCLRRMLAVADGVDAVVPVDADGRLEPLFAIYRRSCAAVATDLLAAGNRRMTDLLDRLVVRRVPLPVGGWYRNLNTPDDYSAALAAMGDAC